MFNFFRPKAQPVEKDPSVFFLFEGSYPATEGAAIHELKGRKLRFTESRLLRDAPTDAATTQAIIDFERRSERKEAAIRLFRGTPNYVISFRCNTITLPRRSIQIFDIPLSITDPGYSSSAIALRICKDLNIIAQQIVLGLEIQVRDGLKLPEAAVLSSNHPLAKLYWATFIFGRYGSCIKLPYDSERIPSSV